MNNIETLTALVELNPEADTLADMLVDALIEEADQIATEARMKVEAVRRCSIDNRFLTRAACLMSMSAASRSKSLRLVSGAVAVPVRFRMVVLIAGDTPPKLVLNPAAGAGWDGAISQTVTVGAEWLWNNCGADDRQKAIEYHARWEANTKARR